MRKFRYTVTLKNGKRTEIYADRWVGEDNWTIFLIDNQEITRIATSEISMIERKKL